MNIGDKASYVREQPSDGKHTCHWPGCTKTVPPAIWGCKPHWFRLPSTIRVRIWAAYSPGQEVSKTPSTAYIAAAEAAQKWIRDLNPTSKQAEKS